MEIPKWDRAVFDAKFDSLKPKIGYFLFLNLNKKYYPGMTGVFLGEVLGVERILNGVSTDNDFAFLGGMVEVACCATLALIMQARSKILE